MYSFTVPPILISFLPHITLFLSHPILCSLHCNWKVIWILLILLDIQVTFKYLLTMAQQAGSYTVLNLNP